MRPELGAAARAAAPHAGAGHVWQAFATVGVIFLLVWVVVLVTRPPRHGGDDDDEGRGGGGGPRGPDRPPSPSGDPAWWPDFERQFAEYAAVLRARKAAHLREGQRSLGPSDTAR